MKLARIHTHTRARFLLAFFALIVLFPLKAWPAATEGCLESLVKIATEKYPATLDVINTLQKFAKDNNLPSRVLEVGPPNRRVNRLFVGVDATNAAQLQAYRNLFTMNGKLGDHAAGVLPLEFQHEVPNQYVYLMLREDGNPDSMNYRWGRKSEPLKNAWRYFTNQSPVNGYAHLIGLTADELKNVQFYLAHPELRAPCKADNCVAWISGIELGRTAQGATDQERKFLFNELGVARSMAHFEIGRRLMNAANARHGAVVVFLDGAKGLEAFKDLPNHLPADPQIPYPSILMGLPREINPQAKEAIKVVPDGAHVILPIAAGASPEAFTALVDHAKQLGKGIDVDLFTNGLSEAELKDATKQLGAKLRLHALFLGSNLRNLYKAGKVHLADGNLGDIARSIEAHQKPEHKYDAIIVRVSPPDNAGHYSLGTNNDVIMSTIKANPGIKVIAEVNPNVPHSSGGNYLTAGQITSMFPSNSQLAGPAVVPYEEVEKKIGENLGQLVDNDAYLQVGIGNLFDGLPEGLKAANKKGIKIYSEMYGDALKKLLDTGVATEVKTGFAFGSPELYKSLDGNNKVAVLPTSEINDAERVAKMPKFDAINTALQVDLKGNVNATVGPDNKAMSSVGGQFEFMSGASRSPGGKAIIAIRSTAKNGTISTIMPNLYNNNITTPANAVTHIVTEYGVADLAGKPQDQKTMAIISVANPRYRQYLSNVALQQGLITQVEAQQLMAPGN